MGNEITDVIKNGFLAAKESIMGLVKGKLTHLKNEVTESFFSKFSIDNMTNGPLKSLAQSLSGYFSSEKGGVGVPTVEKQGNRFSRWLNDVFSFDSIFGADDVDAGPLEDEAGLSELGRDDDLIKANSTPGDLYPSTTAVQKASMLATLGALAKKPIQGYSADGKTRPVYQEAIKEGYDKKGATMNERFTLVKEVHQNFLKNEFEESELKTIGAQMVQLSIPERLNYAAQILEKKGFRTQNCWCGVYEVYALAGVEQAANGHVKTRNVATGRKHLHDTGTVDKKGKPIYKALHEPLTIAEMKNTIQPGDWLYVASKGFRDGTRHIGLDDHSVQVMAIKEISDPDGIQLIVSDLGKFWEQDYNAGDAITITNDTYVNGGKYLVSRVKRAQEGAQYNDPGYLVAQSKGQTPAS